MGWQFEIDTLYLKKEVELVSMNFSNYFSRYAWSELPLISGLVMTLGLIMTPGTGALAQSEEEMSECNQFAASVNRNQAIMATFEREIETFSTNASLAGTLAEITTAASQYVEAVDEVTTNLDNLANDLASRDFVDSQLTTYRDGYVTVVVGFNNALGVVSEAMAMVAAAATEDELSDSLESVASNASAAIEQIETLAVDESNLIDEVNLYCGVE
ncbi:MAG: hypothetical protein F6K00_06195 [Leptolyngbya sp. SIOISBB]|nr:hypothetical protein [Leptolyngbya sp. SIOISBB]